MEGPHSQYPPQSTTEKMIKRYKPIWRFLLISNLALGAYIFAKARTKNLSIRNGNKIEKEDLQQPKEDTKASEEASMELDPTADILIADTPFTPPTLPEVKEPIPGHQQRELFQWMLDEKRKVKPKDREEKKRIDEEKAVLKQFIRADSVPSL